MKTNLHLDHVHVHDSRIRGGDHIPRAGRRQHRQLQHGLGSSLRTRPHSSTQSAGEEIRATRERREPNARQSFLKMGVSDVLSIGRC